MKKKRLKLFFFFVGIPFMLLCTSPLQASGLPSGKEIVCQGKECYERGEYKAFMAELQTEFERAGKAGLLKSMFEKMKKANGKSSPPDLEQLRKRNQRLLEACAEHPNLEICKRVDNVVFFSLTQEQREALQAIESLRYKLPSGKVFSSLEEKLSLIETEFYMKAAMLEIAFDKSKTDLETRIKKQEALVLEKFAKMQRVAKDDPTWVERLALARKATEECLANQFDWQVLKDLTSGKIPPPSSEDAELLQALRAAK